MDDNSHAGQGAVVLDIGGTVGAAVVVAPAALAGMEIEARPLDDAVPSHLPHVAVVARPVPDGGVRHSAVFGALPAATYELSARPAGPVRLRLSVAGGEVTEATWPA
jgi:hypothetical protein